MLLLFLLFTPSSSPLSAQSKQVALVVADSVTSLPIPNAEIYIDETAELLRTDRNGIAKLSFTENIGGVTITVFVVNYATAIHQLSSTEQGQRYTILLSPLSLDLDAVTVIAERERTKALRRLRAVEGTAIYAGKKTEVVNLEALTANLASNQARQIYARVSGLNIYESDDAGLQLSIGGRGLDPNRSASFNTRQNGYDISADVLGYPESYYTPPAEALREIQVVRGAASLQYGTQFGGLVNFVFHEPSPTKRFGLVSRQTVGSFDLRTSYNAVTGTIGKLGYYGFYNYKKGDGFRDNSAFQSHNAYLHLDYALTERSLLSFEYTYLAYTAQQAGGLTDAQFYTDHLQSNRTRNWFDVDWQLFSARYDNKLSDATNISLNLFGLDATRSAVGFRTNRVSQVDDLVAPRDVIVGEFENWGGEARLLHHYEIGGQQAIGLIGAKYYHANNSAIQGPGSTASTADFGLVEHRFPFYPNQSDFDFPNRNLAIFGEHIFYLSDRTSITPGARFEYIKTESSGSYRRIDFDLAGTPIRDEVLTDNRTFSRRLFLFGVGISHRRENGVELFANFSQNYRSVTFNDIRTVNPSFQVAPDISDEDGFTVDAGLRGQWGNLELTANGFGLRYNDRLGEVLTPEVTIRADGTEVRTGRIIRLRDNIGDAFIYGLETLLTYDVTRGKTASGLGYFTEAFANTSLTRSIYTASAIGGVEGNSVEFIPALNLKTGLRGGYGNLLGSLQFTYLSSQFTDASNAPQDRADNQSGIVGEIPAYGILDVSLSYRWNKVFLETGVNNALDEVYFTRRATGYPGPGIIPSAPRSLYLTLGIEL